MQDKKIVIKINGEKKATPKKSYQQPQLRMFGQIHELTKPGGSQGAEGMSGKGFSSDRNVKGNIVQIGAHPLGIGLYLFDYKPEFRDAWGHGRQFGVMVDEVEKVMPKAVSVHPDGYKMVDYAMLGISRNLH